MRLTDLSSGELVRKALVEGGGGGGGGMDQSRGFSLRTHMST
jgi:hypothetical protein